MKNNIPKDIQSSVEYQLLKKLTKYQIAENFSYFVNEVFYNDVSEPLTPEEQQYINDIAHDLFRSGEILRVPDDIPASSEDFYCSNWL